MDRELEEARVPALDIGFSTLGGIAERARSDEKLSGRSATPTRPAVRMQRWVRPCLSESIGSCNVQDYLAQDSSSSVRLAQRSVRHTPQAPGEPVDYEWWPTLDPTSRSLPALRALSR